MSLLKGSGWASANCDVLDEICSLAENFSHLRRVCWIFFMWRSLISRTFSCTFAVIATCASPKCVFEALELFKMQPSGMTEEAMVHTWIVPCCGNSLDFSVFDEMSSVWPCDILLPVDLDMLKLNLFHKKNIFCPFFLILSLNW